MPFLEELLPNDLKSNMKNEEFHALRIYYEGLKGEKSNSEEAADVEDVNKDDVVDDEAAEGNICDSISNNVT